MHITNGPEHSLERRMQVKIVKCHRNTHYLKTNQRPDAHKITAAFSVYVYYYIIQTDTKNNGKHKAPLHFVYKEKLQVQDIFQPTVCT